MTGGGEDARRVIEEDLIALVLRYFSAVDRGDLEAILDCFVPEARFTIATYDTVYKGRDSGIRGMFERLQTRYTCVWHGNFDHVVQAPNRIASRFQVRNTLPDGSLRVKNNCNFFALRDGRFESVQVYMSGDNSLQ
jgi:ketosteroid isomerase-like protein